MIISIHDFYYDLDTSILFFDLDKYNQIKTQQMVDDIREKFFKRREAKFKKNKTITTFNITPSMSCNGRCLYCYNEDMNNTIVEDLTVDKLKIAIDDLKNKNYIIKPQMTRMYGGEPLLCKDLYDILFFLKTEYNVPFFHISTGLFMSDELFEQQISKLIYIKDMVHFSVGVDLGTIPYTRFCPSIDKNMLLQRIDKLISYGFDVVFVNTVTCNTNVTALFEEISILENKYKEYTNRPKFRISIACDEKYIITKKQLNELYVNLKNNYSNSYITSNIFPYLDVIYAPNIFKISDDMYYFNYDSMYCGIFTDMINILPNGTPIHCHMAIDNPILNIDDFKYKDQLLHDTDCLNCDYLFICRGGCFYRKQITDRCKHDNENLYCEWIKKSFELSLYKLNNKENIKQLFKNL